MTKFYSIEHYLSKLYHCGWYQVLVIPRNWQHLAKDVKSDCHSMSTSVAAAADKIPTTKRKNCSWYIKPHHKGCHVVGDKIPDTLSSSPLLFPPLQSFSSPFSSFPFPLSPFPTLSLPLVMTRGSRGVLQLLQRVWAELGHQTHFGAIHSSKFANLLQF